MQHAAKSSPVTDIRQHRDRETRNKPTTVADLLTLHLNWSAAHRKKRTLDSIGSAHRVHLIPAFGDVPLVEFEPWMVQEWHTEQIAQPFAANRAIAWLSAAWKWGKRQRYVLREQDDPTEGVQKFKEPARTRVFTAEEMRKVLAEITRLEYGRPLTGGAFRLLYLTGARPTEILRLTWAEVDLEAGMLRLKDSKTGAKEITIGTEAIKVLMGLPRMPDEPRVFPRVAFQKTWERIRRYCGLENARLYDLRKTFATTLRENGVDIQTIAALLGQKTLRVTAEHYAFLPLNARRRVADMAARLLNEEPA